MSLKKILKSTLNVNCIKIKNATFNENDQALYIDVDMTKGKKHHCPICGKKAPHYDSTTTRKKWRALDFGSCAVYLVADIHRVECDDHGVHTEMVPWAFHHTNFTKEFEQQVAYLAIHLNKTEVSKIMRINWKTVGSIITRVKNRIEPDSSVGFENMTRIGIDETSYRKGHKYVTVVTDHDTNQVVWVGDKTGTTVLNKFMEQMTDNQKDQITLVSADGARWIKSCVDANLPNAERCIDAFHVVSWAIEAMDKLRKSTWRIVHDDDKAQPKRRRGRPKKGEEVIRLATKIKGSKYALGKNPENLTISQRSCLDDIRKLYPRIFRGYQLKEGLRHVFHCSPEVVKQELDRWLSWACRCRRPEFVELNKKIRRHYDAIIATVKHNLSNARIEAMNNKIKVLIRNSYGFRNIQNMIDMIMIICSSLVNVITMPYATRKIHVSGLN
ncbi:MAG: ISL3 family transposase [Erysipelotrichaceae bacterium]|nr:ISL3 family transposase [Erysipelotrichaceae bacterium]MDD3810337.1 ISL3 family transposase [Erysipelotrichaceae bacterium]